jgi:hypothetical protein
MKLAATFARSLQADMQAELLTNSWGDRHYPNQWLDAASTDHVARRAPCSADLSSLRTAAASMVFDLQVSGFAQ